MQNIEKKGFFLQKEQNIIYVKNGFSWTVLIFGPIALLFRRQYWMWIIVILTNIGLNKMSSYISINSEQYLMILKFMLTIILANNINFFRYKWLIKNGYKEIEAPFSSSGFQFPGMGGK